MAEDRNDPSMEEILSSIKRIIADDDNTIKAPVSKTISKKATEAAAVQEDVSSANDAKGEADGEILELTKNDETQSVASEQLLDENKAANLARSFSALQTLSEPGVEPQIVRSGETSLEELTRQLLKPMLKDWLDNNLPSIVEAMVAKEISRITKKN